MAKFGENLAKFPNITRTISLLIPNCTRHRMITYTIVISWIYCLLNESNDSETYYYYSNYFASAILKYQLNIVIWCSNS